MKTINWIFIAVLTLAVLDLSGAATADLNDGLIAYYPFDGNAEDASGNAHHGQVYEATLTPDRFEKYDSAYFFDGVNADRITIPNVPALSPVHFSLTAWIQPIKSGNTAQIIIHNYSSPTDGGYGGYELYFRYPTKKLGFFLILSRGLANGIEIDFPFVPDAWHFLVATYDGQHMQLYVDGVLLGHTENVLGYTPGVQKNMTIGINSHIHFDTPNHYFAGSIDDVRVYNRVLSEAEIQQLFSAEPMVTLDIDGNGITDALTDGIIVIRYLFGFTGDSLISDVVDVFNCTRCNAPEIEAYLEILDTDHSPRSAPD